MILDRFNGGEFMNYSFYSSAVGAGSMQNRLDVVSNNISNVSTTGYKSQNGYFGELVYKKIRATEGDNGNTTYGAGVKLKETDTNFLQGNLTQTGMPLDYAIQGDGFFALYDPRTQTTSYTRDGSFQMSQQQNGAFYLTDSEGKWVLDENRNPIVVENMEDEHQIGVFVFAQKSGMVHLGNNEFQATEKNGNPVVQEDEGVLVRGALEDSNVDLMKEITDMMEIQRVYQMSVKMVQTSDEVENTVNNLR